MKYQMYLNAIILAFILTQTNNKKHINFAKTNNEI